MSILILADNMNILVVSFVLLHEYKRLYCYKNTNV